MSQTTERRCDGCGERSSGLKTHTDDDGTKIVDYCPGCETLRVVRGIKPGEHEQYRLKEVDQ